MTNLRNMVDLFCKEYVILTSKIDKCSQFATAINNNEVDLMSDFALITVAESLREKGGPPKILIHDNILRPLEKASSNIWNMGSIAFKSCNSGLIKHKLLKIMLFAVILLEIHDCQRRNSSRVLKLYIKLCYFSLEEKNIDLAMDIYKYANNCIVDASPMQNQDYELTVLGVSLALNSKDFGMAAMYDSKLNIKDDLQKGVIDSKSVLGYCRILFNSSLEMFNSRDVNNSIVFIEKAYTYLELIDHDNPIKKKLESNVLSLLIRACIDVENYQKAENLILIFKEVSPFEPEPFLLLLNLIKTTDKDPKKMEQTLLKMIIAIPLIPNYEVIISAISDISEVEIKSALKCLDHVIFKKLEDQDYLERLFTTRVWLTVSKNAEPDVERVTAFFNSIEKLFTKNISRKCSNGVVTLIWNHAAALKKLKKFDQAVRWLELCLHRMIRNEVNERGKIQRNILQCYTLLEKFDKVESLYLLLDDEVKENPLTQFYLFKLNLARQDQPSCKRIIENIKNSNDKARVNILSVCAMESNELKNMEVTLFIMSSIMEILNFCVSILSLEEVLKLSDGLMIVSALRSTLQIQLGQLKNLDHLNEIVKLFQEASEFVTKLADIGKHLQNTELEWFAASCYNLALKCTKDLRTLEAQSLSVISIQFIDLCKMETRVKKNELDVWYLRAMLMYLYCTIKMCTDSEFTETDKEEQYKTVCIKGDSWIDKIRESLSDEIDESTREMWFSFYYEALAIKFELEVQLKDLVAVRCILKESLELPKKYGLEFDKIIANFIMKKELESMVKLIILKELFEKYIKSEVVNSKTIAKWSRHLMMNLSNSEDVYWEQAMSHIQTRIHTSFATDPFPVEEIQWFCTTAWNRGVTYLLTRGLNDAKRWCQYCINISQYIGSESEKRYKKLFEEMLQELSEGQEAH